jgi:hypothetical protein
LTDRDIEEQYNKIINGIYIIINEVYDTILGTPAEVKGEQMVLYNQLKTHNIPPTLLEKLKKLGGPVPKSDKNVIESVGSESVSVSDQPKIVSANAELGSATPVSVIAKPVTEPVTELETKPVSESTATDNKIKTNIEQILSDPESKKVTKAFDILTDALTNADLGTEQGKDLNKTVVDQLNLLKTELPDQKIIEETIKLFTADILPGVAETVEEKTDPKVITEPTLVTVEEKDPAAATTTDQSLKDFALEYARKIVENMPEPTAAPAVPAKAVPAKAVPVKAVPAAVKAGEKEEKGSAASASKIDEIYNAIEEGKTKEIKVKVKAVIKDKEKLIKDQEYKAIIKKEEFPKLIITTETGTETDTEGVFFKTDKIKNDNTFAVNFDEYFEIVTSGGSHSTRKKHRRSGHRRSGHRRSGHRRSGHRRSGHTHKHRRSSGQTK